MESGNKTERAEICTCKVSPILKNWNITTKTQFRILNTYAYHSLLWMWELEFHQKPWRKCTSCENVVDSVLRKSNIHIFASFSNHMKHAAIICITWWIQREIEHLELTGTTEKKWDRRRQRGSSIKSLSNCSTGNIINNTNSIRTYY